MSELINTRVTGPNFRRGLLATVSILTVTGAAAALMPAQAHDDTAPTVWIELGGQLQRDDGGQSPFAPAFIVRQPRPDYETVSPLSAQHLPRYSFGGEGKISFQPEGSDWVFSAAVQYGRASGDKKLNQQKSYILRGALIPSAPFSKAGYLHSDLKSQQSESHVILDFMAGKDVGLGLFGRHSQSTLGFGIRFAQFSTKSNVLLRSGPDFFKSKYIPTFHKSIPLTSHHSYAGSENSSRSFRGIGPSVSWKASSAVAGGEDSAELTFDWGAQAALLFGRQKARVHHQTKLTFRTALMSPNPLVTVYPYDPKDLARSRSVIVPDVGGFAGVSMKFPNAKLSVGYRADLFFGAMDGGIDTKDSRNRFFYGPFASFSVGLGG